MPDGPCNIYELNESFIDAIEFMDNVIVDRSKETRRLFLDLLPRGVYPLGEGIVRKTHKFHGGLGDQAGLSNWKTIQISRPPSGNDPGYDACRYESDIIEYGFETLEYTGYETSKRTRDICLKDIKYKWQFRQQLDLIFSFLADITLSTWENFGREMYLKYAADEGQIYVMGNGSPTSIPLSVTYDPFDTDQIVIPRDVDISTLNWSYMTWFHNKLDLEARSSMLSMSSGLPLWGLVIDPVDFDYMIRNDSELREDYRYAEPSVNIDNYGTVRQFKGFTLLYDMTTPRFQVVEVAAATQTLERVLPYTTEPTTVDAKVVVNEEYLNAVYSMGIIFMKDVFEILVPPTIANPGGGTNFGVVPNLMGDFAWLNIQERCDNPKKEKGFYMATYETFSKPLKWSDQAIAFLYKRCPQTQVTVCTECDTVSSAWLTVTSVTEIINDGYEAGNVNEVEIEMPTCFEGNPPAEIEIDYDGGASADVTGVLSDDSEKPTYRVVFADAADYASGSFIVGGTSTARIL